MRCYLKDGRHSISFGFCSGLSAKYLGFSAEYKATVVETSPAAGYVSSGVPRILQQWVVSTVHSSADCRENAAVPSILATPSTGPRCSGASRLMVAAGGTDRYNYSPNIHRNVVEQYHISVKLWIKVAVHYQIYVAMYLPTRNIPVKIRMSFLVLKYM